MMREVHPVETLIGSILGGLCIAIGGTVFLSLENKILGALFFTIGLFVICTFGLLLYTGKVCYVFERDRVYAARIPLIWLGNLCGTWLAAQLLLLTRIGPAISEKAAGLCSTKLADSPLSIFVLAIFCNILIYIGVDGFNNNPHENGKYLALFFGVVVFILCGFEHCIANMFYFSVANMWSGKAFVYLLVMTTGNAVGGVLFPVLRKLMAKRSK